MAIHTSIVDLDSIVVDDSEPIQSKSSIIEALAHSIIELQDLVEFPVVQALGVDSYELLAGHLPYYAYCKACELEPSLPDRITVFVVTPQNREAFLNQLELADQAQSSSATVKGIENFEVINLAKSFAQFTSTQERLVKQLNQDVLKAIDAKLPKPLPLLDAINRVDEPSVAANIQKRIDFIGKSTAEKFVLLLRQAKESGEDFNSFAAVLEALQQETTVKGKKRKQRVVSEVRMLEIIDRWAE